MNTELIFKYLSELKENNNREWYHQHKAEYKEANAQFEELVQELILAIIFEAMKPFNDYLNRALADFQMPAR